MGPFDPRNVELFAALDYCCEQQERYGAEGLEAIVRETEWCAW